MIRARKLLVVLAALLVGAVPAVVVRAQTPTPARTGAIEGAVFEDKNGDEVFDLEEAGIEGVTLRLTGAGLDRTATADEGGVYRFADVPNGTYDVAVEPSAPYTVTDRTRYEGLEVSGDTLASVDFALERAGQVEPSTEVTAPEAAPETTEAMAEPTALPPTAPDYDAATAAMTETAPAAMPPMAPPPTEAPMEPAPAAPEAMAPPGAGGSMAPAPGVYVQPGMQPAPGQYVAPAPPAGAEPAPGQYVAPMAGQMPRTGIEDLASAPMLLGAVLGLMLLAGAGWLLERRS
jgi:hypothetical protein